MRDHLIVAGVTVMLSCACSSESSGDAAIGGAPPGSSAITGTGGASATPPTSIGGSSTIGVSTTGGASGGSNPLVGAGGQEAPGTPASGGVSTGGSVASGTGGSVASSTGGQASSDSAVGVGGRTNAGGMEGGGGSSGPGGGSPNTGGSADTGGRSPGGVGGGTSASSGGATGGGGQLGAGGATGGSGTGPVDTGGMEDPAGGGGATSDTGSGGSTGQVGCDREGLQAAVDTYLAALQGGDTALMPLAAAATYSENLRDYSFGEGIWQTALPVSFSRSFLDVQECQTFTELFVTEGATPYVIGTRLAIEAGEITAIESIVTGSEDWNFDAEAYQTCSESEDWSLVPAAEQSPREVLIAAGEAYFAVFSDASAEVPWGSPCYRLEGGAGCTPSMAAMSQSCNVGIPDGITFTGTHWVVDVDMNTAVGITKFGGALPDTHMFRLSNGKIRFIHTLTVM